MAGPLAAAAQQATLTGTWRLAGGDRERELRHAAIDRATDDLGLLKRGPARDRLRRATEPARQLTLRDDGEQVAMTVDGRRTTLSTDGTPKRVSNGNATGTMQARRQNGRLVVRLRGDNGTRTTVYRLSEDGRRLVLDVRMSSEQLSEPLRYRVTYGRR